MVKALSYNTIHNVLESWENLRRTKNYAEEAGTKLFFRFFDKCPEGKLLFGFPINFSNEEMKQSKRFRFHATHYIDMLESSIDLLGPDIELLTEIMTELGKKHVKYGVTAEMYLIMGDCLVETLQEILGDKFNTNSRKAWQETYKAMSTDMMVSL